MGSRSRMSVRPMAGSAAAAIAPAEHEREMSRRERRVLVLHERPQVLVTGESRLRFREQQRPDGGIDPIRRHQQGAPFLASVLEVGGYAGFVLLDALAPRPQA